MSRGVAGMPLFMSDKDYVLFLRMVERVQQELPFLIHCFCLMPNHFHFLIELLEAQMKEFMQRLKSAYATHFNQAQARRGPLFGGRYPAIECLDEDYYGELVRYITRNPVKAGLVADVADWPWSSHRQIMNPMAGSLVARERVLDAFGGSVARYHEHVSLGERPSDALFVLKAFNSEEDREVYAAWAKDGIRALLAKLFEEREGSGASVERVLRCAARRREFAAYAKKLGVSGAEIARFLGCAESTVCRDLQAAARKEGV